MRTNRCFLTSIVALTTLWMTGQATAQTTLETDAQLTEDAAFAQTIDLAQARGQIIRQSSLRSLRNPKKGALSGKRMVLNPGHGKSFTASSKTWGFQRNIYKNLNEDKHTVEWILDFVRPMLERAGAETLMARANSYTTTAQHLTYESEGQYHETGDWVASVEGKYRYAYVTPEQTAEATWSFNVPKDGDYPVYVRYRASDNRAPDAKYIIGHARGTTTVIEDQSRKSAAIAQSGTSSTIASGLTLDTKREISTWWHYVGTYPFKASKTATITLSNASSADKDHVVISDAVRIGDGPGSYHENVCESGVYRWQEDGRSWINELGVPLDMGLEDFSVRPLYALAEGVDAYLSLHTNAGSSKSRGTQTYVWYNGDWIKESNWVAGHATNNLPPGTYDYAKLINRRYLDYLRKYYMSDWAGSDDLWGYGLGELSPLMYAWKNNKSGHPLIIPSVLVETAFHDNTEDGKAIREMTFRFWGARGLMAGVIQYFNGDDAVIPPLPPTHLTATTDFDHINLTWDPVEDQVLANSKPTHYNLYFSDDGLLFDVEPALTVNEPNAQIPILPGQTLYVRVTAVNEGGESLDSLVGAARLPNRGQKKALYVDGVDREMKTFYDNNNVRSYARIFVPAIQFNHPEWGIDSVDDEAVAELLDTHAYDAVIWSTSQTATLHDVLPQKQRDVIKKLRANGTPLILSGTEIGYAMHSTDYQSDTNWLKDVFNAKYEADDAYENDAYTDKGSPSVATEGFSVCEANTHQAISAPDFMAQTVVYSDCNPCGGTPEHEPADASCVHYPDVLSAEEGATVLMNYQNASTSKTGAAILSADGKAILTGFPLETVIDPNERLCLIANMLDRITGNANNDDCVPKNWEPDTELCDNKFDDDNNGKVDCDDDACANDAACKQPNQEPEDPVDPDKPVNPTTEICDNQLDDDNNGKADCDDDACQNNAACKQPNKEPEDPVDPDKPVNPTAEICDNQLDDDNNGDVDCDDDACQNAQTCLSNASRNKSDSSCSLRDRVPTSSAPFTALVMLALGLVITRRRRHN